MSYFNGPYIGHDGKNWYITSEEFANGMRCQNHHVYQDASQIPRATVGAGPQPPDLSGLRNPVWDRCLDRLGPRIVPCRPKSDMEFIIERLEEMEKRLSRLEKREEPEDDEHIVKVKKFLEEIDSIVLSHSKVLGAIRIKRTSLNSLKIDWL